MKVILEWASGARDVQTLEINTLEELTELFDECRKTHEEERKEYIRSVLGKDEDETEDEYPLLCKQALKDRKLHLLDSKLGGFLIDQYDFDNGALSITVGDDYFS